MRRAPLTCALRLPLVRPRVRVPGLAFAIALVLAAAQACGGQAAHRGAAMPATGPSGSGRRAPAPRADRGVQVVFSRGGAIWRMRLDGSGLARVATTGGAGTGDVTAALSPRGDRIAFVGFEREVPRIRVAPLAGGAARDLTDGDDGGDTDPTWSPDGNRVAFVRGDPRDHRDLYVVSARGGAPALLLRGDDDEPDFAGMPAWSPDGRTIALCADRRKGGGTALWLFDLKTRALTPLTHSLSHDADLRDQDPAWSPDGTHVAFASNRGGGANQLYVVRRDGSGLRRLTRGAGAAADPTYAPDGRRILFVSRPAGARGRAAISVINTDGSGRRRLTRDNAPPSVAPSAARIE